MRVLITGGTGLIGRALAADLADSGHEIVLLSRRPEQVTGLPEGIRAEPWDGHSAAGWGHLAESAAIVNLAGENLAGGRWTAERKRRILESRVNAGAAVVEAAQRTAVKPAVVIQGSAVGFYGPRGDEVLGEDVPAGNDFQSHVVQQWEASTAGVEALGVRRAIMRSGVVFSTRAVALQRMMLPFRFFVGGRLGTGRQWFSWIHIADEVRAIRFLIESASAAGAFNLTAPAPLRNAEFAATLGRAMGRPSWIPVPAFAMRLLFGEMSTVLLDGQRVVPQRLADLGFVFRFGTAESALGDLLRR